MYTNIMKSIQLTGMLSLYTNFFVLFVRDKLTQFEPDLQTDTVPESLHQ